HTVGEETLCASPRGRLRRGLRQAPSDPLRHELWQDERAPQRVRALARQHWPTLRARSSSGLPYLHGNETRAAFQTTDPRQAQSHDVGSRGPPACARATVGIAEPLSSVTIACPPNRVPPL